MQTKALWTDLNGRQVVYSGTVNPADATMWFRDRVTTYRTSNGVSSSSYRAHLTNLDYTDSRIQLFLDDVELVVEQFWVS